MRRKRKDYKKKVNTGIELMLHEDKHKDTPLLFGNFLLKYKQLYQVIFLFVTGEMVPEYFLFQ